MDSVGAPPEGMFDQAKDDQNQAAKSTSSGPAWGSVPGNSPTLTPRQQLNVLSPEQLLALVASQLTGGKTEQQQQQEQIQVQRDQQLQQLEQSLLEQARQRVQQEHQQRVQQSQALKQEIQAIGTPTHSVPTIHAPVSGSATEISLFEQIRRDALTLKQRQTNAAKAMVPQGQQKGPSLEGGAEQKRVSMVDQMVSGGGQEKPKTDQIAPVELPLGE